MDIDIYQARIQFYGDNGQRIAANHKLAAIGSQQELSQGIGTNGPAINHPVDIVLGSPGQLRWRNIASNLKVQILRF